MNQIYVIGVAGGSASGKTTIVNNLKDFFKNDIELISHDCYYKAHYDMPFEEREKLNYDHPNSFDTDLLISDLLKLKNGEVVHRPVYSYTIHNRTKETIPLYPKKVIIVEGILILENEELRNLMDTKIYVDTDADERLMRRILRDMKERGRTIDSVMEQYSNTVKPMHEQFIEPSKKYADIIIPRGGENLTALNILKEHLKLVLNQ
ncbi:uridine kinase [Candidatus Galacturonibacter soehngenii]|uniref:Uridine kinase n=1 Tax=Candidatus Galacturonatibacter soehngenii TaxID=2307010 RepID=A0A7V7QNZ3_9FIRM|nr:uridine kinase [Candidatus Galacturonibacter soehngenii]KAB1440413.1 uridine kinase [Candidatus Galacturonibacter soehngenii]MBA4688935.1 uridine kinase [Candidatus Galacturonibacter soehngenii]